MIYYKNCYKNCTYYHFFDKEYNYHCTNSSDCPDYFPKLISETKECITEDINHYETTQHIIEQILETELEKPECTENFSENFARNFKYNKYNNEI